jgi:hypothetical protein
MKDTITDETLAALIRARSVLDAMVSHGPGGEGWKLQIRFTGDNTLHTLRSQRQPVRLFGTLDSLGRYCDGIGLRRLTVEL